jgi:E3 ubiquitin-protein ligase RNF5
MGDEQYQTEQSQRDDSKDKPIEPTIQPRRSSSYSSHDSDLDRKMPAKAKPKQNNDNRFLCSICLETVSNEPVVTRCGHLYCWTCLYQWLQPGMLLSEYTAAFGPPAIGGRRNGGGLNFLNEMTYSNINANHRPYNPSGGRYNESRRCCPVCKADCTVDSVIPVYIHHSVGEDASMDGGDASPVAAASNEPLSMADSQTPGSPSLDAASSSFDTDPTSNVGLRQRQRASRRNDSQTTSTMLEPMFDSPVSPTSLVDNPDSDTTHYAQGDTPIHRNGNQTNERNARETDTTPRTQVPSRPIPSSPFISNRTLHPTTPTNDHAQPFPTENSNAIIGTSSPFRMALRPRRQPFLSSSPPRAYPNTPHHGGLTSVLMGLVDTFDNLASGPTSDEARIPPLHRSDGGMGGIGRAWERDDGITSISEEESSLELAREFLSRLLLMLACFVVLCLLLF